MINQTDRVPYEPHCSILLYTLGPALSVGILAQVTNGQAQTKVCLNFPILVFSFSERVFFVMDEMNVE